MIMISIINEKDCCGCAACSAVCPKDCITMEKGSLGHLFPVVDKDKCIACGKCEKVCPKIEPFYNNGQIKQIVYAAYAKDEDIRFSGSSGGIFGIFSEELLDKGYVVYGAAFDENLQLKCTKAETLDELRPLLKSKYLQSDLSKKYHEIKMLLDNGKKILFVSTPCQVAAIKKYLGKEYPNLITVDFFCHGVPSQEFFDRCRDYVEKKRKIVIRSYQFRAKKKHGACPHYFKMEYLKNGSTIIDTKLYFHSPFYLAFQKYINLRESCYECQFAGEKRNSDITIGDFHEIDKYADGINRFDGISTVIINTSVGRQLWNECLGKLNVIEMDLERLKRDKIYFCGGTKRPDKRDEFLKDYSSNSFESLYDKWMNPKAYWKQEIYYLLPKMVRDQIKKYIGV